MLRGVLQLFYVLRGQLFRVLRGVLQLFYVRIEVGQELGTVPTPVSMEKAAVGAELDEEGSGGLEAARIEDEDDEEKETVAAANPAPAAAAAVRGDIRR